MTPELWGITLFSVAATVVFGGLFYVIIRALLRADRDERSAQAKAEAEERARFEAERAARAERETR